MLDPDSNEAKQLKKEYGKDTWFAESGRGTNWNMGPTKHRGLCKEIARLAGVEKWESCTGYALRALCFTHCLQCGLSNAEVAAKVRHSSINSSKTHAQETSKRKANRMAVMNPSGTLTKKKKVGVKSGVKSDVRPQVNPEVESSEVAEVVDLSEMQPMVAKNRSRFEHISSLSKKKPPVVAAVAMVNDNKENEVESPNAILKKLETENKILRPQQENQRIKDELTHSSSAPPASIRSRRSGSNSTGKHHRRCEDSEFSDDSDNGRRHSRKCRNSCPPNPRERTPSPHPRAHKRRGSRRHEEESSDDDCHGRCHGRH